MFVRTNIGNEKDSICIWNIVEAKGSEWVNMNTRHSLSNFRYLSS